MRQKKGVITAAKMHGTVTVTVDRSLFHPVYKKSFKRSRKFLADVGEFTDLAVGDRVVIAECRPLSKNKHFRIAEVTARVPRVSELVEEASVEKETHTEKAADASTTPTSKTESSTPQQ